MANNDTTVVGQPHAEASATPSATLPDLNAGKNDWNFVQQLVDRAAWLNMFVVPEGGASEGGGSLDKLSGGIVEAALHRFKVEMREPSVESGVRAKNVLGQRTGHIHLRWSLISDDEQARPAGESKPVLLDPFRSQRFVMQEASFTFGGGEDGFSSFGTGRVFPEFTEAEVRLDAAAVGNIAEGFGKFEGLEGNYVFAGRLTERGNFVGSILLRVVDPNGLLKATGPIEAFIPAPEPDPRAILPGRTYVLFKTGKSGPEQRTTFDIGPQGQIRGIVIPQEYRLVRIDFSAGQRGGLQNEMEIGTNVVGGETSFSAVDPTHPGPPGTAENPATFQGVGTYFFRDQDGNEVAALTPQFLEGRTFAMTLAGAPDQIAARFGCLGPLLEGEGHFTGVQGLLVALSGVALMPHLFNCLQLLYLNDPNGKFLA